MAHRFKATLDIIGINPFVFVPEKILQKIFTKADKNKGPVAVKGTVNKQAFRQSLVKYAGSWRLYINMKMLPGSPKRIGEVIDITIDFDPEKRSIPIHNGLNQVLEKNKRAKKIFDNLPPSQQNEINRYIANLKTTATVEKNIKRAINYLLGKESFTGRQPVTPKVTE